MLFYKGTERPVWSINLWTIYHDDVIKLKHFPRYWPFVRGIHRSAANSPHKGRWRGALMFSLFCARSNCWINTRDAGDLRRHRAHDDTTVMSRVFSRQQWVVLLLLGPKSCETFLFIVQMANELQSISRVFGMNWAGAHTWLLMVGERLTQIEAWISNNIHSIVRGLITHPCLNFSGGSIKPPLKLRHGWILIYYCSMRMQLSINARIPMMI